MDLYEQASAQCRAAVLNCSRECRASNQKYRDTDFDITNDLRNGHNVYISNLGGSTVPAIPLSVSRVSEIFREPCYFTDGQMYESARGQEGTEWFIAAASALSADPTYLYRTLIAWDEKLGVSVFLEIEVSAHGLSIWRCFLPRWFLDPLHSR